MNENINTYIRGNEKRRIVVYGAVDHGSKFYRRKITIRSALQCNTFCEEPPPAGTQPGCMKLRISTAAVCLSKYRELSL